MTITGHFCGNCGRELGELSDCPCHSPHSTPSLRMMGLNLLVRLEEAEAVSPGGIVIPDTAQEHSQWAEVLAVGPGEHQRDGYFREPRVSVGDVIFMRFSGRKVTVDGEDLRTCHEDDVVGVRIDA